MDLEEILDISRNRTCRQRLGMIGYCSLIWLMIFLKGIQKVDSILLRNFILMQFLEWCSVCRNQIDDSKDVITVM